MRIGRAMMMIVLFGLAVVACKKTVEGETESWSRNVQHVQELSALYPGFAAALQEQKKQAEEAMAAARATSDKETPRRMASANAMLGGGFVETLGQIDGKMKRLRQKLVTASTELDQPGARMVIDDAQRLLRTVDEQLRTGAVNAGAAAAILSRIDLDLGSAGAGVDRVIAAAKQRQQAVAAATASAGRDGGAATAAPAAHATWKCAYCGHLNDDAAKKCSECGAAKTVGKR